MSNLIRAALTPMEQKVAVLLLEANSNKEIGNALGIGERTVKQYVCQMLRKHGIAGGMTRIRLARILLGLPDTYHPIVPE